MYERSNDATREMAAKVKAERKDTISDLIGTHRENTERPAPREAFTGQAESVNPYQSTTECNVTNRRLRWALGKAKKVYAFVRVFEDADGEYVPITKASVLTALRAEGRGKGYAVTSADLHWNDDGLTIYIG